MHKGGLVVAFVLLSMRSVAVATETADVRERTRGYYELGSGHYRLGQYREAIEQFNAGYELSHLPKFLLNIAQAWVKLGDLQKARDYYRSYLATAPADAVERRKVETFVNNIELWMEPPHAAQATSDSAEEERRMRRAELRDLGPVADPETKPGSDLHDPWSGRASSVVVPTPVVQPAPGAERRAESRAPGSSRRWVWAALAGGVAIVAAGVGIGVAVGSGSGAPSADLGGYKLMFR